MLPMNGEHHFIAQIFDLIQTVAFAYRIVAELVTSSDETVSMRVGETPPWTIQLAGIN